MRKLGLAVLLAAAVVAGSALGGGLLSAGAQTTPTPTTPSPNDQGPRPGHHCHHGQSNGSAAPSQDNQSGYGTSGAAQS